MDSKTVLILIFFLWIQVYNYFLAYMSSKFVFSERTMYIFVRFIVIYVYPKSLPQPPLFYYYFFIFLKRFSETRIYPFILTYMSTIELYLDKMCFGRFRDILTWWSINNCSLFDYLLWTDTPAFITFTSSKNNATEGLE